MTGKAPAANAPDFATAFRQAGEGMALCDLDGNIVTVNRALCAMLGAAEPEMVGLALEDVLDPPSRDAVRARFKLLRAGSLQTFRRDCRFVHRRGDLIWAALTATLIPSASGVAQVLLQTRDISDAKQVERVMLDSNRRFNAIFNALSEGFLETDVSGRVVDVNAPLCNMLGYGREDLIGRTVDHFIDEASRPIVAALFRGQGQHMRRTHEMRVIAKDGGRRDVQVFGTTLTSADGKVSGAAAILLDVTERNVAQAALRASEQRYRTLVGSIQDGLVLGRETRFEYVNVPFARMLSYTPGDLMGLSMRSIVAAHDRVRVLEHYRRLLRGEDQSTEFEATLVAGDGRHVTVHIHAAVSLSDDGEPLTIATVKDVTERRRIEAELRKLSSAVEHSPTSVFITDAKGVIEYVNPKFCEVTGYAPEELVGNRPSLLQSGETPREVYRDMWRTLAQGRSWRGEFRNKRKDGSVYWDFTSISPIFGENDEVTHYVAVKEDVTSRKENELRNWKQANFDQVTGLPNRILFQDRLTQVLARARRDGRRVAVMFIDLDRFKQVNDTLGHDTGDVVLRMVAERLGSCVRTSDTVARLGGDEFTAILPDPGPEKAITAVARRVLDGLRKPFPLGGGQEVFLGGSIGIAVCPDDGMDASELVRNADQAMYRAKESGRNTYQFFTADMNIAVQTRTRLETELRKALHERQFAVHFQPIVDAATRQIKGAEALVRWAHPARGMLPPSEFVAITEEIGLIGELGALVMRTACTRCMMWRDSGHPDFTVSVNVSGRQLAAPDFLPTLDGVLQDTGLPPEALHLEVVENLLLSDVPLIETTLHEVNARGVKLIIDDFGTGYSSVQHLRRFPFSTLKVDRSFVRDVLDNREDAILVEAVIAMARKMGLSVVAEGVETESQIDYLLKQYCDMFQGFLFGRPRPAEEFEKML